MTGDSSARRMRVTAGLSEKLNLRGEPNPRFARQQLIDLIFTLTFWLDRYAWSCCWSRYSVDLKSPRIFARSSRHSIAQRIELATCEPIRLAAMSGDADSESHCPCFPIPTFPLQIGRSAIGSSERRHIAEKRNPGFRWANRCIRSGNQVAWEIDQVALPTGFPFEKCTRAVQSQLRWCVNRLIWRGIFYILIYLLVYLSFSR